MDAVFKKLNYKEHQQVFVQNAPTSFEVNLASIADKVEIIRAVGEGDSVAFFIAFATQQSEINDIATQVMPRLKGDAIVWLCYPKGTSKNYKCDFNRDTGWAVLGQYNIEPVRAVAIDEDWSALRFRKVEYIKTMIRNDKMTLSDAGKEKSKKN
jgi:hypothetical protein